MDGHLASGTLVASCDDVDTPMRTVRHLLSIGILGAGIALPTAAFADGYVKIAQNGGQNAVQQCPPGSWFCEGGQPQGQVQVQQQPLQPLPGQQPPVVYQQGGPPPPPVVV